MPGKPCPDSTTPQILRTHGPRVRDQRGTWKTHSTSTSQSARSCDRSGSGSSEHGRVGQRGLSSFSAPSTCEQRSRPHLSSTMPQRHLCCRSNHDAGDGDEHDVDDEAFRGGSKGHVKGKHDGVTCVRTLLGRSLLLNAMSPLGMREGEMGSPSCRQLARLSWPLCSFPFRERRVAPHLLWMRLRPKVTWPSSSSLRLQSIILHLIS